MIVIKAMSITSGIQVGMNCLPNTSTIYEYIAFLYRMRMSVRFTEVVMVICLAPFK